MSLRQSCKRTLNFICKYMDFHRKSQIFKEKIVYFQGFRDIEIKLGRNVFTVGKGVRIKVKTRKLPVSYSRNVAPMEPAVCRCAGRWLRLGSYLLHMSSLD